MKTRTNGGYASQSYWKKRSDLLYYRYIDFIIRSAGASATSLLDVGSGNCPYLEWFHWIPDRVSIDINVPYESTNVRAIKGDIHQVDFAKRFSLVTCLQVLEHVPKAAAFSRRLQELGDLVIISVPYKWSTQPKPTPGHVHDPVDYQKVVDWFGREANYKIIVREPFLNKKSMRLIALFDKDPHRKFGSQLRSSRVPPLP